ncbi:MAG: peptidoglycan-binding protein [Treponema sp.]|nr:peptidoglycan-binding protein [Treponema sp.]
MNRRIFLAVFLLLFSGALFASESVVFQWRFRKLIQDDLGDTYDVFLYESANDEEHHLLSLPKYLVPMVNDSASYSKEGQSSISDVYSWYAGGGIGFALFYNDENLEVHKVYFEESEEDNSPFMESKPLLVIHVGNADRAIQKQAEYVDIPEFSRKLKIEKRHVYGDDVFYLQSMLVNFFGQKIDIDGYFGKQTEAAVKKVQKKLGLSQSGVVTKEFWQLLEDASSDYSAEY